MMIEIDRDLFEPFDTLVETLKILLHAVDAHDQAKASEAVTILLMQFMAAFGHDRGILGKTFPILEELKTHIDAKRFDDAAPIVLAFLAKFRAAGQRSQERE